jgi:hypothetical protein
MKLRTKKIRTGTRDKEILMAAGLCKFLSFVSDITFRRRLI